jgi:hypothetical protein
MTCTQDDVTGLGAKLDALELTEGESAALHAIFDAATPGEEVEGYAYDFVASPYFSLRLNSLAARGIIIVGG